uniref:Uncharacterized protein n=1 Tax=Rhipicephalus zambeziensis TaxID=60191 RepID=A0A224Y8V7_9ACAR
MAKIVLFNYNQHIDSASPFVVLTMFTVEIAAASGPSLQSFPSRQRNHRNRRNCRNHLSLQVHQRRIRFRFQNRHFRNHRFRNLTSRGQQGHRDHRGHCQDRSRHCLNRCLPSQN